MRLLNARTLRLEYFHDQDSAPKYAILSHTWGDDEILFQDLDPAKNPEEGKLATTKSSVEKVLGAAREALSDGYTYIWIDSCCIDKSSSAELSEAINSMFSWYAYAHECYAYLSDFTIGEEARLPFDRSRWFSRGWTLQELIAPNSIVFFDSRWKCVGTRAELAPQLAAITKIPVGILSKQATNPGLLYSMELRSDLVRISVSARMLWAEGRETTRVEDRAYSLMGIFDVNMPLLYGEGPKAFRRLQEVILTQTNDQSILAFTPRLLQRTTLAEDPGQFLRGLEAYQHVLTKPMSIVSGDIEVDVLLCRIGSAGGDPTRPSEDYSLAVLHCNVAGDVLKRIAIYLRAVNVGANVFTHISEDYKRAKFPVFFELQRGGDGKTWAIPASHSTGNVFGGLCTWEARVSSPHA
jgi:hypothetical protein